jgi:hypothetical protein
VIEGNSTQVGSIEEIVQSTGSPPTVYSEEYNTQGACPAGVSPTPITVGANEVLNVTTGPVPNSFNFNTCTDELYNPSQDDQVWLIPVPNSSTVPSCGSFGLVTTAYDAHLHGLCWTGNTTNYTVYVSTGYSGYIHYTLSDGTRWPVYLSETHNSTYCNLDVADMYMPPDTFINVSMVTGEGGGDCGGPESWVNLVNYTPGV